jgi:predicted O-methyltransferase YrrM
MNFLKRLQRKAPPTVPETMPPPVEVRPLGPIAAPAPTSIGDALATPAYADALAYFSGYPRRSVMSDHCRAVLYTLIRMRRPQVVVEIGTMYAGTSEVMARALWENGSGVLHTTDPFGGDRCPAIIAGWPQPLQDLTHFHTLTSMDFLHHLDRRRVTLDLVLIDGNHEYEFALFDLVMSAKLLRPGGIIVMDNSEQTGPFKASRVFLGLNPEWRELGQAVASHDCAKPFDARRASIDETSFILLQSPDYIPIGAELQAWGQVSTKSSRFDGLQLELTPQATAGTLHYQAILRGFRDDGSIPEVKAIGTIRLEVDGPATVVHPFAQANAAR